VIEIVAVSLLQRVEDTVHLKCFGLEAIQLFCDRFPHALEELDNVGRSSIVGYFVLVAAVRRAKYFTPAVFAA